MKKTLFILTLIALMTGTLFADGVEPTDNDSDGKREVSTLDHLLWICTNSSGWDYDYEQTANIDASSTQYWDDSDDNSDGNLYNDPNDGNINGFNQGFSPIGNSSTKFTGLYDGQGYIINGLTINRGSDCGLFGYNYIAAIQNLGVTNVSITGDEKVGGLVGRNDQRSEVSNCYSTGSVNGDISVGGLVGFNFSHCTVSNCHSTANVLASSTSVGGLVGYNYNNCTVTNCYSTGNVNGYGIVGGLVGLNDWCSISTSYSTGSVSGSWYHVGGLVGNNNNSTVNNCYSRGNVTRSSGSITAYGGFCGTNNATIEYCYSTGSVVCGGATDKGFVGNNNSGTYTNNFWDSEASNQSSATGATAKITAEMKTHTTFTTAGWDFEAETANGNDDYWDMDYSGTINNGYPYLSWQDGGDVSLPVELSSFSAYTQNNMIIITWTTESELDNLGFILERSEGDKESWQVIASYRTNDALEGQGSTPSCTEYTFTDISLETSQSYYYRLSAVSIHGEITNYPPIFIQLIDLLKETVLEEAYPNPFNPQTCITYHLSEATNVNIFVFDLLGCLVKKLQNGRKPAGSYHIYWNGTDENSMKAPSSLYIIRMQTEKETQIQKVMFMK